MSIKKVLTISSLVLMISTLTACAPSRLPQQKTPIPISTRVPEQTSPAPTRPSVQMTSLPTPLPAFPAFPNRLALVIGNSAYAGINYLANPVNDAHDLAKVLTKLGFKVIHKDNLNRKQMKEVIRQFSKQLAHKQEVGLFYYSGHGIQHQGVNYLIPIGAKDSLKAEFDLPDETVTVDYVFRAMKTASNQVNLLILDACRNPPHFVKTLYKGEMIAPGLASQRIPSGSLIAYAAAPGAVASSGVGQRNSPYVKHLMERIQVPNLPITEALRQVRVNVIKETNRIQQPEYVSALNDPFSFNPQTEAARQTEQQRLAHQTEQAQREQQRLQAEQQRLARQTEQTQREQQRLRAEQQRLADQTEQTQREQQRLQRLRAKQQRLARQTEQQRYEETDTPGKVFRDRLRDGGVGPEMVWIAAGRFKMGNIQGGGDSDEKPVHWVSLNKFAMSKYEVTFAEYDKFAEATGRKKPSDHGWGRGNRPVIDVSWHDATAYAKWLSQQTGQQYRLPTEAEWEYAARAGTTTKYWWGNQIGSNKANCWNSVCGDSFKHTAPVGSFAPNPFGLYDTVGNVWEWTCSEYESKYTGKEQRCVKSAGRFAVRGASWFSGARGARSAYRFRDSPTTRNGSGGGRLARMP